MGFTSENEADRHNSVGCRRPEHGPYLEVYRTQASHMNHSGIIIPRFRVLLDTIAVKVDMSKK